MTKKILTLLSLVATISQSNSDTLIPYAQGINLNPYTRQFMNAVGSVSREEIARLTGKSPVELKNDIDHAVAGCMFANKQVTKPSKEAVQIYEQMKANSVTQAAKPTRTVMRYLGNGTYMPNDAYVKQVQVAEQAAKDACMYDKIANVSKHESVPGLDKMYANLNKTARIEALKNSPEAVAKRAARAAQAGSIAGAATVSVQPSKALLQSFVDKQPSLEKLAAKEVAQTVNNGSRASDMLGKYSDAAKKAGMTTARTGIKETVKTCADRLNKSPWTLAGLYVAAAGAGSYYMNEQEKAERAAQEVRQAAEQAAEQQAEANRLAALATEQARLEEEARLVKLEAKMEQLNNPFTALKNAVVQHPIITAAVVAGVAGATYTVTKVSDIKKTVRSYFTKTEPTVVKLTIEEIIQQAKDVKELAYLLRIHGYTKDDFNNANITTLNKGQRNYVLSQL